jgi:hypothetical protein
VRTSNLTNQKFLGFIDRNQNISVLNLHAEPMYCNIYSATENCEAWIAMKTRSQADF